MSAPFTGSFNWLAAPLRTIVKKSFGKSSSKSPTRLPTTTRMPSRGCGPRYVWGDHIGIVLTRAQGLAMIRSGQVKPERYTINEEEIRIYGATAVVTFRSTVAGVIDGNDVSSRSA